MSFIKLAYLLSIILLLPRLDAQNKTSIDFKFIYAPKQLFITDSVLILNDSTQLQLTELKFYISKITFFKNKKIVFEEKNSYHLIDASKLFSQKIELQKEIDADEFAFNLGIDSVTNTSGAMGGDLDPTKGMYWTWQSGYINFKLEGKSNLCKTPHHAFQFHLGGYAQPYSCLELIVLPVNHTTHITVQVDVKKIVQQLHLSQRNKIMSPTKEAVILSKQIASCFNSVNQ